MIEAKSLAKDSYYSESQLRKAEPQLSRYASGAQIKQGIGILTDGRIWRLYDLSLDGRFSKKRLVAFDFSDDALVHETAKSFYSLLSKHNWQRENPAIDVKPQRPRRILDAYYARDPDEIPASIWIHGWEVPESQTPIEQYQIQFRIKYGPDGQAGNWCAVTKQAVDQRRKKFYSRNTALTDPENEIEMRMRARNDAG